MINNAKMPSLKDKIASMEQNPVEVDTAEEAGEKVKPVKIKSKKNNE